MPEDIGDLLARTATGEQAAGNRVAQQVGLV